jgi:hypothetical protein
MQRMPRLTSAIAVAALVLSGCSDPDRSLGYQMADLDLDGEVSADDEQGYGELLDSAAETCDVPAEELADLLREAVRESGDRIQIYDVLDSWFAYGKPERGCAIDLRIWVLRSDA